jgi:uncharacterized membrane protein
MQIGETKLIGLLIGLTMGVIVVWVGWWPAVLVGALGTAGYLVGKYLARELPAVDKLLEMFVDFRRRGGGE